ncbi:NosD domain-containing protein [Methanococcus sp. CF]
MKKLKIETVIFLAVLTCLACISSVSADKAINTTCTISTPGNYYLTSNISCSDGDAITITCSDVVIDGQGYTIEGVDSTGSGIYSNGPYNITVKNTNVKNFGYGIYLSGVSNGIITNNTANSNTYAGIGIITSRNISIINNTGNLNRADIQIAYSQDNKIINNTLKSGINLFGNILRLWNTQTVENNNVNGKPIYYFKNKVGGTVPADAGQVILANCSEMIIENLNLSDVYTGAILGYSSNNTLINNTANNNNRYGICLDHSDNNTLTNNTANSNHIGIELSSLSENNAIISNNVRLNYYSGIYLELCNNNRISNNTANSNSNYGICLHSSSNNTLKNNTANSNHAYGIYLESSSDNNQIYNNIFNNTRNYNIWSCGMNYWNTSKELGGGNYWFTPKVPGFSEITPDWNNDGFCDYQHNLSTNNTDYLPILWDKIPPEISIFTPVNETVYNTSSILINATANDSLSIISAVVAEIENIKNITLTLNGSCYTANTGNLSDGVYNINVTVTDAAGNINTTKPIRVTVDTTNPNVVINNGFGPYDYNKSILNVTVSDLTLVTVIAEINGTKNINLENISGYFGNSDFEFAEGEHNVTFIVTDLAGNVNSTENVNFRVDLTYPVITVNTVEGEYFNNGSNVLNFSVEEEYIDSITAFNGSTEISLENITGDYLNANELADGVYNVTMYANDTAGNIVNKTVSFTVDTVNPEVTIVNPATGSRFRTSSTSITVTANDSLSDISSVVAQIGSVRTVTLTQVGDYYTASTGKLSDGSYEITIIATDLAGNVNSSETTRIVIDTPNSHSSSDVAEDIESDVIRNFVSGAAVLYGTDVDMGYAAQLRDNVEDGTNYTLTKDVVIVGGPEANGFAKEYNDQFELPISNENPGEYTGVIQVMKVQENSGSIIKSYTIVYIAGSDRLGTLAALEYFKTLNELPSKPITVKWTVNGPVVVK